MFGVGVGVRVGGQRFGGGFDSDYQAVLNYATTQGYTLPSVGQQVKQNQFVVDLKTAGIWANLDMFYMFWNDGGSQFATLNWKSPSSFQATLINSPTFASNAGFKGNGLTSYISLNFRLGFDTVKYVRNNASRYMYVKTESNIGAVASIDGNDTNFTNRTINQNLDSQRINSATTNLNSAANLSGTGMISIHRTSSTNVELFVNNTQISRTATSVSLDAFNQTLFRAGVQYANPELSMYAVGQSLVSENSAFVSAFNTYIS
jgi:hypothetical protein